MNVLYVEDDEIATHIGISMLKLFNEVSFVHAGTGYKALELFTPDTFDVLLVDLGLPDISGVELVQMIKEQHQVCPPVIAITAHINPNDDCPPGISRVYAKPLTYELIQEVLNYYHYN